MPFDKSARPIVVFDLDGVLIDSAEANVQAFRFGLEQVGVVVKDRESILELVGYPAFDMLAKLGCPEDELVAVFENFVRPFYVENLPTMARAYPGAREVLEELKEAGFQIGSCTSGDRTTQTSALQAIGLWDLIEKMQTPDDSKFGKPDARYLKELLARFDSHGDVHHVEDSEVGLTMGIEAGATIYYATYGNGHLTGKVEPDATIDDITELPQAILSTVATRP
jgi:phosphoglycolate phosphatase